MPYPDAPAARPAEPRADTHPGGRPGRPAGRAPEYRTWLDELRAAAFGDRCGLDVAARTPRLPAVPRTQPPTGSPEADAACGARAGGRGHRREQCWERDWEDWAAAVVLGGQGRYAAAAALLRRLVREAPALLAAQAAVALASHRRQLGGHAVARALDGTAVRLLADVRSGRLGGTVPAAFRTDGVDLAGARADAFLGLAADAVGLGRLGEARVLHDRAKATLSAGERDPAALTPSWRSLVRAEWISAEISLGLGDPDQAIRHGQSALEHAQQGGSLRHAIKSELVRSAGLAMGATAQAIPGLRSVVEQATASGLVSLVWPAALILAECDPERAAQWTDIARKSLVSVVSAGDPELIRCARSSPWVPWSLLPSGDGE